MDGVWDVHVHPAFFEPLCGDPEVLAFRRRVLGLPKTGIAPLEHVFHQMDCGGIRRLVLLPLDLTIREGRPVVTNEEIRSLVDRAPGRFVGFASVDPRRPDREEVLERAFGDLGLAGLKLQPSRQGFDPGDPSLDRIYQICRSHRRPILFHAGLSWEPETRMEDAHPLRFEAVAARYPDLNICLAHFGWPWVRETAALMLKYPNVYADTGLLYFDSAREFYDRVFRRELDLTWVDRSLRHQVLFGSDNPRFEQLRMVRALEGLGLRESTLRLVLEENARVFLGEEGP